jgi:hypothetical protein
VESELRHVVQFFSDTGAEHPLWSEDGSLLEEDDLQLSVELWRDLHRWAYEASWPDNYLDDPEVFARLETEGLELYRRTAAELGPTWDVRWRGIMGCS